MNFQIFEQPQPKFPQVYHSSKEVYDMLKDYGRADREVFLVILLTAKNQMIDCQPLFIGSVDSAGVWPREIVKAAVAANATNIILVHNHPSGGDPEPSEHDREVTKAVISACRFFQINILDHIIIGRERFFSFADAGIIEELERTVKDAFKELKIE